MGGAIQCLGSEFEAACKEEEKEGAAAGVAGDDKDGMAA
jgi:hypothetical protein